MLGVLEVILRHDPVPGQSFGAGQGRIAFIASLEIVSVTRLEADESGRLISLGGLELRRITLVIAFVYWRDCPPLTQVSRCISY